MTVRCMEKTFITAGFSNWKNASGAKGAFEVHQSSHCHILACESMVNRFNNAPVLSQLSKKVTLAQASAQRCLKIIFTSCRFLLHRGLAFRGHDAQDGNLMQLIKLRCDDVPEMVNWLSRKQDFLHSAIQNEIMQLYADAVVRRICSMVNRSMSFAVIVDGTQDINRIEQESICIRFVDDDLHPHEAFVGFYAVGETTGRNLARCVEDVFVRLQLP